MRVFAGYEKIEKRLGYLSIKIKKILNNKNPLIEYLHKGFVH